MDWTLGCHGDLVHVDAATLKTFDDPLAVGMLRYKEIRARTEDHLQDALKGRSESLWLAGVSRIDRGRVG